MLTKLINLCTRPNTTQHSSIYPLHVGCTDNHYQGRSIKTEDITKHLEIEYILHNLKSYGYFVYGEKGKNVSAKYYPNIFADEKTGWVDGVQGNKYGVSEQDSMIFGKSKANKSIEFIHTSWDVVLEEKNNFVDIYTEELINKYYELFSNKRNILGRRILVGFACNLQ